MKVIFNSAHHRRISSGVSIAHRKDSTADIPRDQAEALIEGGIAVAAAKPKPRRRAASKTKEA